MRDLELLVLVNQHRVGGVSGVAGTVGRHAPPRQAAPVLAAPLAVLAEVGLAGAGMHLNLAYRSDFGPVRARIPGPHGAGALGSLAVLLACFAEFRIGRRVVRRSGRVRDL